MVSVTRADRVILNKAKINWTGSLYFKVSFFRYYINFIFLVDSPEMGSPGAISFLLLAFIGCCQGDLGYILMQNSVDQNLVSVPSQLKFAPYLEASDIITEWTPVVDMYPDTECESSDDLRKYSGKIVIVKRQQCTFADQARHVQESGGKGIIVVSEDGLPNLAGKCSNFKGINITISVVTNYRYEQLRKVVSAVGINSVSFKFHAPKVLYYMDIGAFYMCLFAVFTCALGAWLQTSDYVGELEYKDLRASTGGSEDLIRAMSYHVVVELTAFRSCLFLTLGFILSASFPNSDQNQLFFTTPLFFIVMFCIASCIALYDFLRTLLLSCFTHHIITIPVSKIKLRILTLLLILPCAGVTTLWAVTRHSVVAWILLDVLGFAFCVYGIRRIKFPTFKDSAFLLGMCFVADLISYITKNNDSSVSIDGLPIFLKFPAIEQFLLSKCDQAYTMLTFSNVIIPGLHVGFCAVWDYRVSKSVRQKGYFTSALLGYLVGLCYATVEMQIMMTGQSALFVVSPCCLLSTVVYALTREELGQIWRDEPDDSYSPVQETDEDEFEQEDIKPSIPEADGKNKRQELLPSISYIHEEYA